MNWTVLLTHSLTYGLILSTLLTVLIMISLKINPEMWHQDYPDDVKAKWGPMSEKAKQQRTIFAIPMFGLIIGAMALSVWQIGQAAGRPANFLEVFVSSLIIMEIFNLVDAVIIDWLFLMKLWPNFAVLPGTEGMAGYTDMKLQWQNFLKGFLVASPVMALLTGGISALVTWIAGLL